MADGMSVKYLAKWNKTAVLFKQAKGSATWSLMEGCMS
jgi:hypothetical protein